MAAGDKDAKTEQPTPKKKKEARKEGSIPRSTDLLTWTSVLVGSVLVKGTFKVGEGRLTRLWAHAGQAMGKPDQHTAMGMFGQGLLAVLITVSPLVLGMMALGIAGNLAQVGWTPSGKKLKPKLKRLNPGPALKKMFSPQSVWELIKSISKLVVLGWLGWRMLLGIVPALTLSGQLPLSRVVQATIGAAMTFARNAAVAGLGIAALDYGIQRKKMRKSIMMTKQQVKDESRQSEGDPKVKAKIRERQYRMSRMRMMAEVAKADVVIVNPTHVAVALVYEPLRGAPRVVAKGADEVALAIRREAETHKVALVQDVPLARAIYAACKIDDEIPADLYEAVARVLAFIMAIKTRRHGVVGSMSGAPHQLPLAMRVPVPS